MCHKKALSAFIATATFTLLANPVIASKKEVMEEVIITGITGAELPLSSIPGAAQVIDKQALDEQMKISNDIADMMANLLPGYSPSNQLASNFGQSFRGKKAIVLIDGVLQTTPIRNASREFMTIAPEAIERIEVINGSSALYGNGYAGGVVNFVTRKATDELKGWSSAEFNFQPKDANDTAGWSINQGFSGPIAGNWDFVANFNYRDTGKFVDAEGDLLPEDQNGQGGYANGSQYDLLLKLGYGESDNRVDITYHRYHMDNGLTYNRKIDPITGFTVIDTTSPYTGDDPSNEVESLAVSWSKDNVLGQTFKLNASIGDNKYEYATTAVKSKKYKLVPLFAYGSKDDPFRATYGISFEKDTTTQYLKSGAGCWICDVEKTQLSPFAQAWYQATEKLEFQLGVRHEQYRYDVPTYQVIRGPLNGQLIKGDTLKYKETIFNSGVVFHATDAIDIFGGYSEGYAVDDLRRLRGATKNQVSALKQDIPATKSHNIEVGLRGQHQSVAYSVSIFRTFSENAAHYGQESNGAFPNEFLIYADEKIKGIEATLDYYVTESWKVGGSFAYSEGKYKDSLTRDYEALNGSRITPTKYTAYVHGYLTPNLDVRLQVLHSSDRNKGDIASPTGYYYYESPVSSYTTADLSVNYQIEQGRLGTVGLSIRNLMNEDYVPASAQINQSLFITTSATAYKAQGRAVTLSWSKEY